MATPSPESWLAADPDDATRQELSELLANDPVEVARRFDQPLDFGTAGLRGPMGAGPSHMNRMVVRRTAAATGRVLLAAGATGPVVIGFDARRNSRTFALDSARVLAALGIDVALFAEPVPTPVVAFATGHLNAAAAIVVTASHNPATDNGYKLYWSDGAQINAPVDVQIAAEIDRRPIVTEAELAAETDTRIREIDPSVIDNYVASIVALLQPGSPRHLSFVYTPMHGVGGTVLHTAFARAGFIAPVDVDAQSQPDPTFPTAPFPNPEEAGALDLAMETADTFDLDLIVANDPDADRLAVAVRDGAGTWVQLTGDQIGCLLAEYLLAQPVPPEANPAERLVTTTVVSSTLLSRIASAHRVHAARTLTGFKWIVRPALANPDHQPVLSYEEALGYAVGATRDKDGISAALVFAEMAATARSSGRTVLDLLADLDDRYGPHRTGQRSIRWSSTASADAMTSTLDQLRTDPPTALGEHEITAAVDYAAGHDGLPPTNLLEFQLANGHVIIRPSGTEPKLKIYAELVGAPGTDSAELADALNQLLADAEAAVAARSSSD